MPIEAIDDGHGDDDDFDDTLRILLATDIHLGYAEKHQAKAPDSFVTFEEILQIAIERKVDMLLLGGDLFHDNKPSRHAEMMCIDLLRKYVLGSRPVSIQLVSDPAVDFRHCERKEVNYMDPNMNIGLPVFSIHGNHDDPSGLGGHSCMDLLHTTGLLNYFGRVDDLNELTVSPLLIKKGSARLALYGMSAVKDERLHRMFRAKKVHMLRPEEDTEDWFNLLVLHQNRAKHGVTNYIPEHFIEGFVDLVFWGHEHECRLAPEDRSFSEGKRLFVTQPGSSVATSLCEAEAKEKQVGILEIRGKEFKIRPVTLKTVRPMVFRTINIEEASIDFKGNENQVQTRIENYLKNYVEDMLIEAENKQTGHPKQPLLPLIRLRVEYTDETHQLTPGRFGNHFHDRVANPSEILLFRKKIPERKAKGESIFESDLMESLIPAELEGTGMEDLVSEYFNTADDKTQLRVLSVKGIAAAVNNFIEKDDKDAVDMIVEKQLKTTQIKLLERNFNGDDDDTIDSALEEYKQDRVRTGVNETAEAKEMLGSGERPKRRNNGVEDMEMGDVPAPSPTPVPVSAAARGRGATRARARGSRAGRGEKSGAGSIQGAFQRQRVNASITSSTRSSARNTSVRYVEESESD